MPEPSEPATTTRPRLTIVAAGLVVMAAAGVSLMIGPQRSSGAPIAAPTVPAITGLAVPPASTAASTVAGSVDPTTATSTAPTTAPAPAMATSAATAPPAPGRAAPPTTATTGARPRPPVPSTPAPTPPAATTGTQLQQVEGIADTSGWDWRKFHVQFRIGFDPASCCHWGVYDPNDHKTIWIGPTAFDDAARLRYVVLHELAHAWQFHSHRVNRLEADMAPWGYSGLDALEAGADCIATDWGADVRLGHYWTCPPDAQALMARRLAGQWK
jgi:hypothetical protein